MNALKNMNRVVIVLGILITGLPAYAELPLNAAPRVGIVREGGGARLEFTGSLQTSPAPTGPWAVVTQAVSPLILSTTNSRAFYRAIPSPEGSIFSQTTVVTWTLTGPLQTHFNLAFAGSPDGIFPPVRQKPYFDGALQLGALNLPVSLRVRGNSSLQECPFPKLKFKIAKLDRVGTPFFDAREIKIGTHCAEGGRGNIGRLRDERATYREALAYEVMTLLGFPGPRVRRAQIEFHDTSPTNGGADGGWQVTRNAVLLDDIEVVAERLGGRALSDSEVAALPNGVFAEQVVVDLQFLHALLGNWDYGLGSEDASFQNTEVIELADKSLVPVAGDFDLASWVTEEVRSSAPRDYRPGFPAIEREALYQMEQIRRRVSPDLFLMASNRFTLKQTAMTDQIAQGVIDEPGRTNALRHVSAFLLALTAPKN